MRHKSHAKRFDFVQGWCIYLPQGTWDSSVVVSVSFFGKLLGQQLEGKKQRSEKISEAEKQISFTGLVCSEPWFECVYQSHWMCRLVSR